MTGHTVLLASDSTVCQPLMLCMGLLLQPTLEENSSTDTFLWELPIKD
jgi:hypothetical protein